MPKSNINPKRFSEEIPIEEVELERDYNGKAWVRIKKMEVRKKIYANLDFDERIYNGLEFDFIPAFKRIADALLIASHLVRFPESGESLRIFPPCLMPCFSCPIFCC